MLSVARWRGVGVLEWANSDQRAACVLWEPSLLQRAALLTIGVCPGDPAAASKAQAGLVSLAGLSEPRGLSLLSSGGCLSLRQCAY